MQTHYIINPRRGAEFHLQNFSAGTSKGPSRTIHVWNIDKDFMVHELTPVLHRRSTFNISIHPYMINEINDINNIYMMKYLKYNIINEI
jgi:hypothetical protein